MGIGSIFKGIGGGAKKIGGGVKKVYQHPVTQKVGGGIKSMPGKTKTAIGTGAGFMGGLAVGGFRKSKDVASRVGGRSDTGTLFLVIAFFIFIFDLFEFGGGRYIGFQWAWNFRNMDIIFNIVSSSIFGLFMLIYVINRIIKRDWQVASFETFSYLFFAFFMTFLILNNAWIANPKAIIHFVFILFFGFTFIKTHEDSSAAYLYIVLLLFLDFFAYSWLRAFIFFEYIPILFVFVIFYIYGKEQNPVSIFAAVSFVIILFFLAYSDIQAQGGEFLWVKENSGPSLEETIGAFVGGCNKFIDDLKMAAERQMQYAITGKVEKNEYEPLGVTLENVQSDFPRYYEDEDVVVFGTVKARTLDDPVNIKVGCYVKDSKGRATLADEVNPDEEFKVYTLEEQDFACTFKKCEEDSECALKIGSNSIKTYADFNFETLAYLKTYFINRETQRAMVRQGLDVFEEYNIKDKRPIAVYTNGPVEIGMETTMPLIGVSDSYIAYPTLSISLNNRLGWEGKIIELNELTLFFPAGVELEKCNREFKEYSESDCLNSCEEGTCC